MLRDATASELFFATLGVTAVATIRTIDEMLDADAERMLCGALYDTPMLSMICAQRVDAARGAVTSARPHFLMALRYAAARHCRLHITPAPHASCLVLPNIVTIRAC